MLSSRSFPALVSLLVVLILPARAGEDPCDVRWSLPDELDAVVAAPESHKVLFENDKIRVLEVVIAPGEKELPHSHRWPSVMMVDGAARIRYYNAEGKPVFETPKDRKPTTTVEPEQMGPEGLHAVENIDTVPFHAIRVEFKCPRIAASSMLKKRASSL